MISETPDCPDKRTRRTEQFYSPRIFYIWRYTRPTQLGGQLCSTLGAAASQNLAAIGGGHSLAEAVNLLSVQLLGLIGTLGSTIGNTAC